MRVPAWIKPAIGGLGLGLLALALPQVLGGGYGWIQEAIDGRLALHLLLLLLIAKMVAMSLTVSSGGSGGVFAPSLYVGAMLGGAFAGIFHHDSAGLVIEDRSRELMGWVNVCQSTTRRGVTTYVYVNNHYARFAPATVEQFQKL